MGINAISAEALIRMRSEGKDFGRVLTLGRMDRNVSIEHIQFLLCKYRLIDRDRSPGDLIEAFNRFGRFADPLFTQLGAISVDAVDASPFEGAKIIHNLDVEISETLHEQFDFIFDGGLLEHVFNFPIAIKSCMDMLTIGGTLLLTTPANNECGHGFYQFSPELFFRLFNRDNGFRIESIIAVEETPDKRFSRWFKVTDPAEINHRVLLVNREPVYLLVSARKTAKTPVRLNSVVQHDYGVAWSDFAEAGSVENVVHSPRHMENINEHWLKRSLKGFRDTAASIAPGLNPLKSVLMYRFRRFRSLANATCYKKIKK